MEDDAERVAMPRADAADAVTHRYPIVATRAAVRSVVDREHDRIALAERNDFGTRLHSWTLLGQDKFATAKILTGVGQQHRYLKRKDVLAV